MEAAVGVALLSRGEANLCPACEAQGPCKVRQMVAAPGKSTQLLSSAICRAAMGLASGSSAHVPSPWGSPGQRQRLGPHCTARLASLQQPWQGWGSARGYYHRDFLSSPGQGSRETHGIGMRSLGPSSPETTLWECQALGRQRLSCAPNFCQLPAASFPLQ